MIAALLIGPAALRAEERVSVYRCVTASGAVSLQDYPCADEAEQTLRRLPRPLDAAVSETLPAAPNPAPTSEPPLPPPAALPAAPPPPLWLCVDFDGARRESADGVPRGRHVPLWVVGRDAYAPAELFGRVGRPLPQPSVRPPSGPRQVTEGPVTATQHVYVEERCYRLSTQQACASYAERRTQIERRIFNAQPSERETLRLESEELRNLLQRHCGR